jgi:hypothetical protein
VIEGVEELDLVVDEEFADGFGVEFGVDDFEADVAELGVKGFEDSGGESGSDFLEFGELIGDSFAGLRHAVFFDIISNRKGIIFCRRELYSK